MAVVRPPGSNTLRAALKTKRWSYSRLASELRRRAALDGVTLPMHESLVTLISRWVNNHQQPDGFYRDLLSRALGTNERELFEDGPSLSELTAGAAPGATSPRQPAGWRLARLPGPPGRLPGAVCLAGR